MTTAEKIEYQRRSIPGMTQEELAQRIGIRAQTYRNKITGKSSFKIEEVVAIAETLGMTVEQLLSPLQSLTRLG